MKTRSELKSRYEICKSLHGQLESYVSAPRRDFQQAAENADYYGTIVVEEMRRLQLSGVSAVVDEKDEPQLMHELRLFMDQEEYYDYMSTCHHTLRDSSRVWDNTASTSLLFLVPPSDLDKRKTAFIVFVSHKCSKSNLV